MYADVGVVDEGRRNGGFMKKKIICVATAIMLLCAGCGNVDTKENESTNETTLKENELVSTESESTVLSTEEPTTEERVYLPNEDPDQDLGEWLTEEGGMFPNEIANETEYDNMVVEMEKTTYKIGTAKIIGYVKNLNVGKGFWAYHIPLLEYNDNGEWVRMRYYTEDMRMGLEMSEWCYVMNGTKEGETVQTICHRAPFVLFTDCVLDELVPGLYRLVMCVGPNKYYAEFTLEE